jgi:hypothetical protein
MLLKFYHKDLDQIHPNQLKTNYSIKTFFFKKHKNLHDNEIH